MDDEQTPIARDPRADAELMRLDRLVGEWVLSGDTSGTISY